jgi:hypothetical protein
MLLFFEASFFEIPRLVADDIADKIETFESFMMQKQEYVIAEL